MRTDGTRYLWRAAGLLVCCLLLASCGFQLRDDVDLPPEMNQTQLVINDPYSPFARRLRTLLEQAGVSLVDAERATAVLEVPTNNVVTDVLTIGDNARVREYRVTHTVRFRLSSSDGTELVPLQTLRQSREISFDEQEILAASREQEYLRQDLVNTISRQLVSRLGVPAG